jgi:hypothetical protein
LEGAGSKERGMIVVGTAKKRRRLLEAGSDARQESPSQNSSAGHGASLAQAQQTGEAATCIAQSGCLGPDGRDPRHHPSCVAAELLALNAGQASVTLGRSDLHAARVALTSTADVQRRLVFVCVGPRCERLIESACRPLFARLPKWLVFAPSGYGAALNFCANVSSSAALRSEIAQYAI